MTSTIRLFFVVTMFASAACSNIAQLAFGESLRDDLIVECCTCLFENSSNDERATCTEAVLIDGEFVVPDGAVFGSDETSIPCLCSGDDETCIADLRSKTPITVPGACVDALDGEAPCEAACGGVLSFSPVPAG